jgi:Flp pilus assembly protein TadB
VKSPRREPFSDIGEPHENLLRQSALESDRKFWRGERNLSAVQVIGIALICGVLVWLVWDMLKAMTSIVGWLFLGGCGALFLLLRWRTRKALSRTEPNSTNPKIK